MKKTRCAWCSDDPLYIDYHDKEWGIPLYDGQKLFEMLCLEGQQAGLSWITILKKRQAYYELFDNFDPGKIAKYKTRKIASLLNNPAIIRNRLKINAIITNAQCYLEHQDEFSELLWKFVDGKPILNKWKKLSNIPTSTKASKAMSKELKRLGFKFVGETICYAFMQAVGMVNDHTVDCFKYKSL